MNRMLNFFLQGFCLFAPLLCHPAATPSAQQRALQGARQAIDELCWTLGSKTDIHKYRGMLMYREHNQKVIGTFRQHLQDGNMLCPEIRAELLYSCAHPVRRDSLCNTGGICCTLLLLGTCSAFATHEPITNCVYPCILASTLTPACCGACSRAHPFSVSTYQTLAKFFCCLGCGDDEA